MRPTIQYFLETWEKNFPSLGETEENYGVRFVSVKDRTLTLNGGGSRLASFSLPEDMSVEEAYEYAFRILQNWQNWEHSLYEMMANHLPVSSIVEQASLLLEDPFALMDDGMNILARSGSPESYPEGTIWDTMTGNNLVLSEFYTPEEMQMILRETSRARDGIVLYSPKKDPDHTYLSCALQKNGQFLGTIGSVAIHGEFTRGQLDVMRCAANAIALYLENAAREEVNRELRDGLLETLLSSSIADPRRFAEFYENHGWESDSNFRLLTIVPAERVSGGWSLHMALSALRLYFPTAAIALLRDRIALVCAEAEYRVCFEEKAEETELFFRQRNLRCGISNRFYGGTVLTEYYRQSSYAASAKNVGTVVGYDTVNLNHFVEMLSSGLDLIPYCDPTLVELFQSEKESDRILVDCFDAYLKNGRNISKTARAMYVNRNTLIYRLEKLENLLGLSLDELPGEKLMSLLLSCELLLKRA